MVREGCQIGNRLEYVGGKCQCELQGIRLATCCIRETLT